MTMAGLQSESNLKRVGYFIPAIVWTIILLTLCLAPGKDIPSIPWLNSIHFDKVVHFCLFGGFVLFWCYGILKQENTVLFRIVLLFTLLSISLGIAVEFMQKYWIPDRDFEIGDMIADAAGAILAAILFSRFKEKLRNFPKARSGKIRAGH